MAGKSFVQMKATFDDIREVKDAQLQKAGKEMARMLSTSTNMNETLDIIDKLLKGFSDSDKYVIMKYAFVAMI